jgi:hypothetical protein
MRHTTVMVEVVGVFVRFHAPLQEEENLKKKIVVTDLFVEIYNFNVSSQIDK